MRGLLFVAVLATISTAGRAEVSSSLAECMSIESETARVQCYDRVLGRSSGPETDDADERRQMDRDVQPVMTPAVVETKPNPNPQHVPSEVEVREAVSTPAKALHDTDSSQFGFDEPRDPQPVIAVIEEIRNLPRGQFVLTLDNGQVWREIEVRRQARFSVGQPVTIRKRTFAYWLTNDDTGFSNRVKRLR